MAGYPLTDFGTGQDVTLVPTLLSALDFAKGEPGVVDHPQCMSFELMFDAESNLGLQNPLKVFEQLALYTIFLVMNPKEYNVSMPFAKNLTYTNGGIWLEESGQFVQQIDIVGTPGVSHKPSGGLNPFVYSGFQHFHWLKWLFEEYGRLKAEGTAVTMIFRNYKDEYHQFISPTNFQYRQSASSPMAYEYHITFDAYRKINGFFNPLTKSIMGQLLADPIRFLYEQAKSIVDRLTSILTAPGLIAKRLFVNSQKTIAYTDEFWENAADGWTNQFSEAYERYIVEENQIMNEYSFSAEEVDLAKEYDVFEESTEPVDTASNLQLTNDINNVVNKNELVPLRPEVFGQDLSSTLNDFQNGQVNITGVDAAANALDMPGVSTNVALQTVLMNKDTDLKEIASQFFGDPAQWKNIAVANNLKAPYVDYTGSNDNNTVDGTVKKGASVQVPVENMRAKKSNPFLVGPKVGSIGVSRKVDLKRRTDNPDAEIYGTDIMLNQSGDLIIADDGKDFTTVNGKANLYQGLMIKINTPLFANILFPYIGFKSPVGEKMTLHSILEARANLEKAILMDFRVGSVNKIRARKDKTMAIIECEAVVNGTKDSVNLNKQLN